MKKIIFIIFIFFTPLFLFSQTWQSLDSLRLVYQEKQSYDTAIVFAEKALQAVKTITGEKDTLYAKRLSVLFELYYYNRNYPKAIEYCEKEKEILKITIGEKHPDYAQTINNLAYLYSLIGKYSNAESLYLESLKIRKEVSGEKDPDYALSVNNLACLYHNIGNYTAAEKLYLEAKNIRKEVLGVKHPDYAVSLNNLAVLYDDLGNYSASEPLYLEAMNIRKESVGVKHPDYAQSLSNLSVMYLSMGNFAAAEQMNIEAKNIYKDALGEKHPSYARSINNLGVLYKKTGNYIAAEPLLIEAKNIFKEILGEKHASYALLLNNLAALYEDMGNYSAAETLYINSKNIRKEVLGEKHYDYAISLNNLAVLYRKMGNYSASEPLLLEAKKIIKEVLGEKHSDYANILFNLAQLYQLNGDNASSKLMFMEYLDVINAAINQNFAFLSEKEKEMYFKTKTATYSKFYSFSLKRKTDDRGITETVYNNVVKNKGLLLKSSTAMRMAIVSSKDTALISQYSTWIGLKKEISKLYSTEISKRSKNPEELEQHANVLEKDLVKGSQVFSDFEKLQNLTWVNVKNNLKQGEAAVEFMQFTEGKKIDSVTYCALLITPDSKQPEMIRLFEEKQMLEILDSATGNNLNQVNHLYGTNLKVNESLYKLIWQPLEKYLEGVKTVYYSPEGILHKVSFAAIGKSKNMYLCDHVNLQQVSSTGKVAMPENALIDKNLTACIVGGIDYTSDSLRNSLWQYLPGTLTETNAIKTKLLKNNITTKTYSGKEATELSFKNIYSNEGIRPEILHIATHGFFYPDPEQIQKEQSKEKVEEGLVAFRGGNSGFGLWQFVKNKNPLMRSGVVFAGANKVWSEPYAGTDNEGVLTAQEVTQLDMTKTKLVVLSACETGLGDIKGSEGVYGLQRAFKMAGVKFIVMSLWQVPDKETVEFMETFYTKLLKDKNIRLAFSETQKVMRKKYDPYYWGAFVLVE